MVRKALGHAHRKPCSPTANRADPNPVIDLVGAVVVAARETRMAHDPTTRSLVILAATIAVLLAGTVRPAVAKPDRCCVADRCRRASATRCAKLGGMDIGQGSCQPNPCAAACGPDCSSGTCPAAGQACVFDCTTSCGCRDCSAANCSCTAGFCSSSADCPSGYSCVPNPCSIPIGSGPLCVGPPCTSSGECPPPGSCLFPGG